MMMKVYEVKGMTCDHCVRAVSEELAKLDGVEGVEIHLPSGRVTVTSAGPVPPERVAAAVDEAGYALVA